MLNVDGLSFGVLEMGSGPLAHCLHGFPDSAHTWQALAFRIVWISDFGANAMVRFAPTTESFRSRVASERSAESDLER
jgi:hypothetical protein